MSNKNSSVNNTVSENSDVVNNDIVNNDVVNDVVNNLENDVVNNVENNVENKVVNNNLIIRCIIFIFNIVDYVLKNFVNIAKKLIKYYFGKNKKSNNKTITAFGCRSPYSEGFGLWDGAFIYARNDDSCIYGLFIKYDYIGYPLNDYEGAVQYYNLINEGWIPMTVADIEKTSGIKIDSNTVLVPHSKDSYIFKFWQKYVDFKMLYEKERERQYEQNFIKYHSDDKYDGPVICRYITENLYEDKEEYIKNETNKVLLRNAEWDKKNKKPIDKQNCMPAEFISDLINKQIENEAQYMFYKNDNTCLKNINNASIIFGCRSPYSKGVGCNDEYLVCYRNVDVNDDNVSKYTHTEILYKDNNKYIAHPLNIYCGAVTYYRQINKGWIPMTKKDIEQTLDITISDNTNIKPPLKDHSKSYDQYIKNIK